MSENVNIEKSWSKSSLSKALGEVLELIEHGGGKDLPLEGSSTIEK